MSTKTASNACIVLVLLLLGCSLASCYRVATAADAVPSPMTSGTKFPQVSQVLMSLQMFSPELVAYVENPKTVCTLIVPSDKAMTKAMESLGEYVGIVLQNETMQGQVLNHHVIPDQKIPAQDMGTEIKSVETRAGEPLYFVQYKNVPHVAFGRKYVQPIAIANIQAGGCIMHIVDKTLMAPPSLIPQFEDWLRKAGNPTALQAPRDLWLQESAVTAADKATTAPQTTTAAAAGDGGGPTEAKTLESSRSSSAEVRATPESGAATSGAVTYSYNLLWVATAGGLLLMA